MARPKDIEIEGLVRVGHISGVHGVRGDVVIKSYTGVPLDIGSYGPLQTQHGTTLSIRKCRVANKGVVAFIDGVTNRNAAEALKGTQLFVDRELFPEPDEEEWYVTDLIGLDVRDAEQTVIGSIMTVHDFGAGELLELNLVDLKDSLLVPFTQELVPEVRVPEGYITVHLTSDMLGNDAQDDKNATAPVEPEADA